MSERIVYDLIPFDWNGNPYFVASELKRLLASVADYETSIDSGTMDGQAHLWVTIGGTEYFITVEKASGRSKSNPLVIIPLNTEPSDD
jgi:hypothetical protein